MSPPLGKCVWCERTDFTEEHIVGRQFTKAIGITFPAPTTWGRYQLPEGDGIVLKDRVCDTCNKNWMRKLDNKAMSFLGPALRVGQHTQLNQRQQEIVSIWATKIALLLALRQIDLIARYPVLAENGDNAWVPDGSFAAIAKNKRRPPHGTRVWLGALAPNAGQPPFVEGVSSIWTYEAETPSQLLRPVKHAYFVSYCLSRLVVIVHGRDPHRPAKASELNPVARIPRGALRRIYPSAERVTEWPPPETFAALPDPTAASA